MREGNRYPVTGAGELIVSTRADSSCGKAVGFSLAVTWGRYGEAGGVIDHKDARRLAEHILRTLGCLQDNA